MTRTSELLVEIRAIRADDALLDTLHAPSGADAELTSALAAWRWWIHTAKSPPLVDTDTAVAAINAAREEHDHRELDN